MAIRKAITILSMTLISIPKGVADRKKRIPIDTKKMIIKFKAKRR